MTLHDVTLADRFDLSKRMVLLGGIRALVRMLLMQKARDEAAGLDTAGYVTGYRGSPLGGVDLQMWRASKRQLAAADVSSSRASTRTSRRPRSGARSRPSCAARAGSTASSASGTARARASTAAATSSATPTWPAPRRSAASSPASATTTPAKARRCSAPLGVRARRRDDADPLARRRAGDPRLRPARLGALALHRLLGRAEVRQGHHRGHRGRRRRPAPAEDRRAGGFPDAAGRA